MASIVLVNAASADGTYGQGGKDGDYFVWKKLASSKAMSGNIVPLTLHIEISGTATVTVKGAYKSDGNLVPISGATYSSSIQDSLYGPLAYFAFVITVTSGTVTVAAIN